MSGWRLGYAIGPVDVIRKMALLHETISSCLPPFIQMAGVAALTEHQEAIEEYKLLLKRSRDLLVRALNAIPGITCPGPEGAIYAFPNITGTGLSSAVFAQRMLEEAGVALQAGTNFGARGEGYVRLCFARDEETIREGCSRIAHFLSTR